MPDPIPTQEDALRAMDTLNEHLPRDHNDPSDVAYRTVLNYIEAQGEVESRNDLLEAVLQRVYDWTRAYPIDIFPESDLKRAQALLRAGGMTIDSISSSAMRHITTGIERIIAPSLPDTPPALPGEDT